MKLLIALLCLFTLPAFAGPAVSTGTGDSLGNSACGAQMRDRGEHLVENEEDAMLENQSAHFDSHTDQWVSSGGAQQEGGCFNTHEP